MPSAETTEGIPPYDQQPEAVRRDPQHGIVVPKSTALLKRTQKAKSGSTTTLESANPEETLCTSGTAQRQGPTTDRIV